MSSGKDKRRAELEQLRWQGAESGSCIPKCGNSVDRLEAALRWSASHEVNDGETPWKMTIDLCQQFPMAAFTSNGRRQHLNKNRFFSRVALLGGATLIAVLLVEVGPAQAVGKASATLTAPAPGDVFISDDGDQVVEVPAGGGPRPPWPAG